MSEFAELPLFTHEELDPEVRMRMFWRAYGQLAEPTLTGRVKPGSEECYSIRDTNDVFRRCFNGSEMIDKQPEACRELNIEAGEAVGFLVNVQTENEDDIPYFAIIRYLKTSQNAFIAWIVDGPGEFNARVAGSSMNGDDYPSPPMTASELAAVEALVEEFLPGLPREWEP